MAGNRRRSIDERKEILAEEINSMVSQGWRVESQTDFHAVFVRGHRVNHVLHLLLTLVTFGVWAIAWLALAMFGGEKRTIVHVDEWEHPGSRSMD